MDPYGKIGDLKSGILVIAGQAENMCRRRSFGVHGRKTLISETARADSTNSMRTVRETIEWVSKCTGLSRGGSSHFTRLSLGKGRELTDYKGSWSPEAGRGSVLSCGLPAKDPAKYWVSV